MNTKFKSSILIVGLFTLIANCSQSQSETNVKQEDKNYTINTKSQMDAINTQNAFVEVSKQLSPSIVNIRTKKTTYVNYYNPLEQLLFGRSEPRKEKRESGSLGSGFIISTDGYVMTNNHVIDGADEIYAKFSDGREFKAELVGSDPEVDVAILKITSNETFKSVNFANSDTINVGEWSIAFGNPLGLNDSMTVGIVSAKGRTSLGIEKIENFIQTDAAINQGNSGGPLVNIKGEVIGINTAIYSQSGGSIGLGFAIPANLAVNIKDSIIKTGKVERPFMGVELQDLTPELSEQFDLKTTNGVLITNVQDGSPASKANLKQGDVIVEFDNVKISSASQLIGEVASEKVGTNKTLKYVRNGKEYSTTVTLSKKADTQTSDSSTGSSSYNFGSFSGKTITPSVAKEYGFNEKIKGIVITDIKDSSSLKEAGLEPGLIISEINRQAITNTDEFNSIYKEIKKGNKVLLYVMSSYRGQYVTVLKD